MVLVQHSVSNLIRLSVLGFVLAACGSAEKVQQDNAASTAGKPPVSVQNTTGTTQQTANSTESTSANTPSEEKPVAKLFQDDPEDALPVEKKRELVVSYENKSTSINVPLDLDQPFYLELKGTPVKQGVRYDRELVAAEMRQIMRDFRKGQDLFFKKEYEAALDAVNRSLNTLETADALALKGSIYYMMKNIPKARSYWAQAVKLDPEIVVPEIKDEEEKPKN
jgi:tetratricopeptide (TPR) repeat protein